MSNLDNLIAKITADGDEKVRVILAEANLAAARIIENDTAKAVNEKDEIISMARAEAARQKDQLIMQNRIAVRDAKLTAKRKMFDKVISMAVDQLEQMSSEQYKQFLIDYLAIMDMADGDELILPEKYQGIDMSEIKSKLKNTGLTMHQSGRKINNGFAVINGGVEYVNTFEALCDYYRDDLEKLISDTLF